MAIVNRQSRTIYFNDTYSHVGATDYVTNGSNTVDNQGDVIRKAGSQNFWGWDDAPQLKITSVTDAVNYWDFQGAIASSSPVAAVAGSDANIAASFYSKGNESLNFGNGSGQQFEIEDNGATTVNWFKVKAGATGVDPTITSPRGAIHDIAASQTYTFNINGQTHAQINNIAAESTSTMWWRLSGGTSFARLYATGSASNVAGYVNTKGNAGCYFSNSAGTIGLFDSGGASSGIVNYVVIRGSATGAAVKLLAAGSDADIDFSVVPKGSAYFQFGEYTAGVVVQAGYITIKDSGGTLRRLLVG